MKAIKALEIVCKEGLDNSQYDVFPQECFLIRIVTPSRWVVAIHPIHMARCTLDITDVFRGRVAITSRCHKDSSLAYSFSNAKVTTIRIDAISINVQVSVTCVSACCPIRKCVSNVII